MLDRNKILSIIDAAYASRMAGDNAALEKFWAPGATFQVPGEPELLRNFPLGPTDADAAVRTLIDMIDFHTFERVDAVVEGNRAAIIWEVTLSSGASGKHLTRFFDLWELDDEGRARSLIQFIDTSLIASLLEMR